MYTDLTASFLTEALGNIFYRENGGKPKYQSVDTMMVDWTVETNQIKRIEFAAVPEGDGAGGTDIIMAFKEHYYDKYDTFKIEESGQHCFVASSPVRKADNYWEYIVRLIDTTYDVFLEVEACQPGMTTRWISNAMPELHEQGTTKWQSNAEKFRTYIMTHRNDASYSALYAAHEDTFVSMKESKGKGAPVTETIYRLDKVKKNLMDNFLTARNNQLLFGKSNIGPDGKPTIVDPDTNRPIYISDGVIAQVEAFASKYAFNNFTVSVLETAIAALSEKAESPTGNHFLFITNERGWQLVNKVLAQYLAQYHTDGAYLWSKAANDYVQVGAKGFDTYNWAGNSISFKVDRTFSREYGYNKAYFLCLDLTADKTSAQPPMAMFSLKGGDIISNIYEGVGKENGLTSGSVASPVAGTKLILWGYSGIAVFNPYRSYIARQI